MQQNLMKKTAVGSLLFFAAAMSMILYLSATKVISITNVVQDGIDKTMAENQKNDVNTTEQSLTFQLGAADTSYLRIPLPEGCKADDILIENHYMDKELLIRIDNKEKDFFAENVISGNRERIEQGTYDTSQGSINLKFRLTGIYEYRTILENNNLYVSFLSPGEMYDKIIVIDPACGGMNDGCAANGLAEKDISLKIAEKLKEKLDEGDIKAYYTRMADVNPGETERVYLANQTKADMYIRIQANSSEDTGIYGTEAVYNGDYFIPGFGSIELADLLEREVVTSIKGKALGLVEAQAQEYAVRHVTVPAATIKVGYLTNKQEAVLLGKEEYLDKIADGIYNAIMAVYNEK